MTISDLIHDESAKWRRVSPASPAALDGLIAGAGVELPEDYLAFLRLSNGGEGALGVDPGWFQIWPVEQVLQHQHGYKTDEFIPGFFGFGSSGGGELLAFDARVGKPWPVVMIPFIPMRPSTR